MRRPRGRYVSLTIRGGSPLPALTPSTPPQPISMSACLVEHLHLEPGGAPEPDGDVGHASRGQVHRRRVREVAADGDGVGGPPPTSGAGAGLVALRLSS